MQTKQTIAIIGASGNMGSAISKSLSQGNYRLLLKGYKQEDLEKLINEIQSGNPLADVDSANCPTEASWEADIIILAVPIEAEREIAEKIREVASQKIVISVANPLNASYAELVASPDTIAAEQLQILLPNSKVVKAFNTTFAADFSKPVINGTQVDVFIAGNDEEALETVAELVRAAGFNPINAGDLKVSRTLENM